MIRSGELGSAREAGGGARLVELAGVVENDLRRRQRLQPRPDRGIGRQVAQHAVTQPAVWNLSQLLLHRFHPVAGATAGELQEGGKDRGEPADRPGEVDIVKDRFPAVAFEVDQQTGPARPTSQRRQQGGDQRIAGLGVIGGGDLAQQRAGFITVKADADVGTGGLGIGTELMVNGKRRAVEPAH